MSIRPVPITATLDGLSFGTGPDADGFSMVVNSWDGWNDPPPANPQVVNKIHSDGAHRGPNTRGAKYQQLICTGHSVSATKRELLMDKISAICADKDTVYPLVRNDYTRSLFMYVERDGRTSVQARPDGHHVAFTIPLVSRDPYRYTVPNAPQTTMVLSPAGDGLQWSGSAGGTGVEWLGPALPTTGLTYQTIPGAGGTIVLSNSGSWWAPIIFTISASATTPSILNQSTGERITFNGSVSPGGSGLIINTGTGRAELNGANVTTQLSVNQFFKVPPKSSIVVVYSATSSAGSILSGVNSNVYL